MVAVQVHPDWVSGTNYTQGNTVKSDGVIYEARSDITSSTTDPRLDTTNWRVAGIFRIENYYSLIEAIRLELNVPQQRSILESIPHFINLAEDSFATRLRPPVQRTRRILMTDADSKIEIPQDLLEVINLRINSDTAGNNTLIDRGKTEILAGNFEEYRDLKRLFDNGFQIRSRNFEFEAPVYWYDNQYFWIAPDLDVGTEIELWYYASIPQLGSTVFLVDSNGNPINADGMTSAQWVAAGNTAESFVQATSLVLTNWFIFEASQMLLYGALVQASAYLHNDARTEIWQQKFERAEVETTYKVQRFENHRPHIQQMSNIYSV